MRVKARRSAVDFCAWKEGTSQNVSDRGMSSGTITIFLIQFLNEIYFKHVISRQRQ